jgi:hypothetical protein
MDARYGKFTSAAAWVATLKTGEFPPKKNSYLALTHLAPQPILPSMLFAKNSLVRA